MLLFAIIEFGRAVFAYNSVAHLAREGVRYAIVRGADSGRTADSYEIQSFVQNRAAGLHPLPTVTTTWTPDNKPGSEVQVQVSYTFEPIIPLIPTGAIVLSSTSRMVISF
jgi:Flp pilus assembly protein TadG